MIKNIIKPLLCVAVAAGMAGCSENDVYIGGADTGILESPDGNVVYITDGNGRSDVGYVEFRDSYTLDLFVRSSKTLSGNVSATFSYDPAVLDEYNKGEGTEIALFPQANVSLADGGRATIAEGSLSSAAMGVTMTSAKDLDPTVTYAVPLRVNVDGGQLGQASDSYIILVRDITSFPRTDKYYDGKPGMKIIGVIEVNNVNPLNVMGFTLKDSGKQFFDMVVLFSANINFNAQTGRVYVSRNENVQAILDNRDKYIKPLQDRGIKVVLGVLGNHDASGISTLRPQLAKEFAKEVKNVCDAYGLDGIFLDDEWSDFNAAASGAIPGFCAQSSEAASRLAYEIRKAQPQRLLISYRWEALTRGYAVDGMDCSQIWDYVCNDYLMTSNPVDSYPGLRQNQAATGSWNCADGSGSKDRCIPSNQKWSSRFSLTGMREEGYGAMMIYNFTCNPSNAMTNAVIRDMGATARDFWNAELEYDNSWYPKDF